MPKLNEPFWIWSDIDGEGDRWMLAYLTLENREIMINFPQEEFTDYFDAEDYEEGQIIPITKPNDLI